MVPAVTRGASLTAVMVRASVPVAADFAPPVPELPPSLKSMETVRVGRVPYCEGL